MPAEPEDLRPIYMVCCADEVKALWPLVLELAVMREAEAAGIADISNAGNRGNACFTAAATSTGSPRYARDASDVEIIAINIPNTTSGVGGSWTGFRTSVDALEQLTGYDLLALLPDPIERVVEAQVGMRNVEMDVQPSTITSASRSGGVVTVTTSGATSKVRKPTIAATGGDGSRPSLIATTINGQMPVVFVAAEEPWADSVTVELEYRTDTLEWQLYAQVIDTATGNTGNHGIAALRRHFDAAGF